VLAQLEGSGRRGLAAYDKKAYDDLEAALATFNDASSATDDRGGGVSEGEGSEGGEEGEEELRRSSSSPSNAPPASSLTERGR